MVIRLGLIARIICNGFGLMDGIQIGKSIGYMV